MPGSTRFANGAVIRLETLQNANDMLAHSTTSWKAWSEVAPPDGIEMILADLEEFLRARRGTATASGDEAAMSRLVLRDAMDATAAIGQRLQVQLDHFPVGERCCHRVAGVSIGRHAMARHEHSPVGDIEVDVGRLVRGICGFYPRRGNDVDNLEATPASVGLR